MRQMTMIGLTAFLTLALPAFAQSPVESAMQENKVAMERMMKAMDEVKDMDPDIAFAKKMKAHHQGAIDMADVETRYGVDSAAKDQARAIKAENIKSIRELDAFISKHSH